ncbi:MAG: ligase-associated DNA damage response endonuclease PdeM [Alphaproteobacteria bacterium]|nr:ligase-associated DNA damage response endonuclease PdeM [Alphaproteobacteria bacterium]
MTPAEFRFAGERLLADPSGALIWPGGDSAIVADLHFEKGSAFAAKGTLLPPYDSRETLRRVDAVLARHPVRRVICLGDSFHDGDAPARLGADERAALARLTARHDWIWITGNHDPALPDTIGGVTTAEYRAAGLVFRHQAAKRGRGEISGHFHPKAAVAARGRRLTGRCFVTDGQRLILPAFGAYTGGLDVRDPAIESLLARDYTVLILGRTRVHRIPRRVLRAQADDDPRQPLLL